MGKDCRSWLFAGLCLFSTGCFSYAPYGHPGAYAPPHTAMAPQPYGNVQVPPGTVWVPASPAGATTLTAPDPVRKPSSTTLGTEQEPASGNPVPEPVDPQKSPLPMVTPGSFEEDASIERLGVRTSQLPRPRPLADEESDELPSMLDGKPEPELAVPEVVLSDANDAELPRSNARSAEFSTQVRSNVVTPVSATNERFGYDRESYSWLQGTLEFDAKQKVWYLMYSQSPDDDDQFGGEVTLKNSADFKYLRSGQLVRVEGQFDPTHRDRLGKPMYEASRIDLAAKR